MSDCSNSQEKKDELISVPPVLRDVNPHDKCRTMPVTLSAPLFYFRALPQILCFPFPIVQFGNAKAGGYRKFQIVITSMSGTNVVVWHVMKYYLVSRIWQGNKDAGLPSGSVVRNLPANAGGTGNIGLLLGQGDPLVRKWQPTSFLPRKSHGQRRLVGYSAYSHKELRE